MDNKLNIFISYSHEDEDSINTFKKHLVPLEDKGNISIWSDRKMSAGDDWANEINDRLRTANIICLMISAGFLASKSCKDEIKAALKLEKEKGVKVISTILSQCGWKDNIELSKKLALPKDGRPIDDFPNKDAAWHEVYKGLKNVIREINSEVKPNCSEKIKNREEPIAKLYNIHTQVDWTIKKNENNKVCSFCSDNKIIENLTDEEVRTDLSIYRQACRGGAVFFNNSLYSELSCSNGVKVSLHIDRFTLTFRTVDKNPFLLRPKEKLSFKIEYKVLNNILEESYNNNRGHISFNQEMLYVKPAGRVPEESQSLGNSLNSFIQKLNYFSSDFKLNIYLDSLSEEFLKYLSSCVLIREHERSETGASPDIIEPKYLQDDSTGSQIMTFKRKNIIANSRNSIYLILKK